MKKFAFLTAPFLCMSFAAVQADSLGETAQGQEFSQSSYGLVVDSNGQRQVPSNGQSSGQKNGNGQMMRQVTPEAEPRVMHWADPFLTAEFIWWEASQQGLQYATSGVAPTGSTTSTGHGRVHSPGSEFEPGFKLGFGLRFAHDGWDLYGNWTWLNGVNENSSVLSSATTAVTTMWDSKLLNTAVNNPATVGFDVGQASANWEMKLNALDLEMGRNFYISPRLTLRPHFGLKFGWISQDYNVHYNDFVNTNNDEVANYRIDQNQSYFGVGIRTGLDTMWYFTKHFGLYADFAFGAMWSDFDVHRKDVYQDAVTESFNTVHSRNHTNSPLTEVLELGIGFRYDTTFFVGDYAFYLQAGWEEQIWFDQNQFFDLSRDASGGNLSFQGLSVKAGLMF